MMRLMGTLDAWTCECANPYRACQYSKCIDELTDGFGLGQASCEEHILNFYYV